MQDQNKESDYFKRRFEIVSKYTDDIILIIDLKGKILNINKKAESVFGLNIIENNIKNLFIGIDSYFELAQNTQIVQSLYLQSSIKKNIRYPFMLTIIPLARKNKIDEIIVIGKDLWKLESYREEVENLEVKLKGIEEKRHYNTDINYKKHIATLRELEVANNKLEEVNKKLLKELELASILQKSLVPSYLPEDNYFQFAFRFEPMGLVGGDFYDIIDLKNGKKGVMLADVSGHGVSAAFIAAMLKISFNNYAHGCTSPSSLLNKLNREYCQVIQTGDYITAFYAIFDPLNKQMTFSGAGHPNPFILHRKVNRIDLLPSYGFFVGMFDATKYVDTTIDFLEDDRYLVYTDGIIEAYSKEKREQFGGKRLLRSVKKYKEESIDNMIESIIKDVKQFMHRSNFYDDLAIVSVEYKK